jgi:hypothetical protein
VRLPRLRRRRVDAEVDLDAGSLGEELYEHEYIGRESSFGLAHGPCHIERTWAGGYIIRDQAGRRWTVAKKEVRRR